ncbi:hypothetical protein MNB_SM-7-490 [hydrothermal vent metagenome]|uniref:Uncharacterized protein n=1 Tax=hydrothermal vent metagenome TaxID=652676 RepID=A0A1W1BUJ9_9ZZZZ
MVVFEAMIKSDGVGGWFIELKDTTDGRIEVCKDLDEFEVKIEEMGDEYGGHIDEVRWLKDEDLHPAAMDDIRTLMAEKRAKIEEERGDFITPVATPKE